MRNYRLYYKKLSWLDPEQIFLTLYNDKPYSFWLDFKDYSYMGIAEKKIKYSISNHTLSISNNNKIQKMHQSILDYLEYQIQNTKYKIPNVPFDFTGGFIGYLGYEMKTECCPKIPYTKYHIQNTKFPDAYFFFVDKFLAFDHQEKKIYLVALTKSQKEANHWFETIKPQINSTIKQFNNLAIQQFSNEKPVFSFSRPRQQYLKDILACQKHLYSGDAYQICLTNQITAKIRANWLSLFLTLRKTNPAPASAYINFGDFALLSSSPEQFLKIDKKGWVTSQPMKGTIQRSNTREKDLRLAKRLGTTEKDYAENIMILDLMRNDLGKVCEFGSIKVLNPLEVQTYSSVHQLVSTVKGKLLPRITIIDLLKAAFPGGSMTGAPKIRACQIIEELEQTPRGIYSGTFGFLSLNGTANLAMTIRTIIATKNRLSFGSGGAILSDSIPKEEYEEMLLKAQPLIDSIKKTTS